MRRAFDLFFFLVSRPGSASQMMGLPALGGALLSYFLLPYIIARPESTFPALRAFLLQLLALELLGDLFLYLGHRIQHENQYLWENFHSVHHQVRLGWVG
jgi:sterol desaturase/sphingolipid hydroxylase (fatty acid hydroxylase superfamily)